MVHISAKTKLNFRFHNPNTAEATADYILKIFIEANQPKIEELLRAEALKNENKDITKGRSA